MVAITAQRGHHHVLWQQAGAAAFRQRNINQRHNGATKIENPKHVAGGQRNLGDQRPLQDFFHIQNREAETFAAAAEDDELRFRRALANRSQSFQHFAEFGACVDRSQLEIFTHQVFLVRHQTKRRTARKSSSRVKGFVT